MLNAFILVVLILLLLRKTRFIIDNPTKELSNKHSEEMFSKMRERYNFYVNGNDYTFEKYLTISALVALIIECVFYFYLGKRFDSTCFALLTAIIIAERIWVMTELPHYMKMMVESNFDFKLLSKFYPYSRVRNWYGTIIEIIYYILAMALLVKPQWM